MVVMFGIVGIQGIRMLAQVDFRNNNNLLVAAVSIGLGLGVTVRTNIFQFLPNSLQIMLGNGVVVGSLAAVGLNLLFNRHAAEKTVDEESVGLNEENN